MDAVDPSCLIATSPEMAIGSVCDGRTRRIGLRRYRGSRKLFGSKPAVNGSDENFYDFFMFDAPPPNSYPLAKLSNPMSTKAVRIQHSQGLLNRHQLHEGVYARIAKKLRVDASYVSRIARGERKSPEILNAVLEELRRIEKRVAARFPKKQGRSPAQSLRPAAAFAIPLARIISEKHPMGTS
jgi:transcriptional regulator with XRE-family HTH domain